MTDDLIGDQDLQDDDVEFKRHLAIKSAKEASEKIVNCLDLVANATYTDGQDTWSLEEVFVGIILNPELTNQSQKIDAILAYALSGGTEDLEATVADVFKEEQEIMTKFKEEGRAFKKRAEEIMRGINHYYLSNGKITTTQLADTGIEAARITRKADWKDPLKRVIYLNGFSERATMKPEHVDLIQEMINEGQLIDDIAAVIGVTPFIVSRFMEENNIVYSDNPTASNFARSKWKFPRNRENAAIVISLIESGFTLVAAAKELKARGFDVSNQVLRSFLDTLLEGKIIGYDSENLGNLEEILSDNVFRAKSEATKAQYVGLGEDPVKLQTLIQLYQGGHTINSIRKQLGVHERVVKKELEILFNNGTLQRRES